MIIYGYVCRIASVYFFWESKTLGWTLVFVSIIYYLIQNIKSKKLAGKKTLSEKIVVGFVVFVLLIECIMFFITPTTDAYKAAKQFLLNNKDIKTEVGEINNFFLIPVGGVSITTSSQGTAGEADLSITIKGSKKYKDINLYLAKSFDTDWIVEIVK